jgi:hypothetical protein
MQVTHGKEMLFHKKDEEDDENKIVIRVEGMNEFDCLVRGESQTVYFIRPGCPLIFLSSNKSYWV